MIIQQSVKIVTIILTISTKNFHCCNKQIIMFCYPSSVLNIALCREKKRHTRFTTDVTPSLTRTFDPENRQDVSREIRTPDRSLRRRMLYPAELLRQNFESSKRLTTFNIIGDDQLKVNTISQEGFEVFLQVSSLCKKK